MTSLCLLLAIFVVFATSILIKPIRCVQPRHLSSLNYDDLSSLPDKLPSIIDKGRNTVNRFRCPEKWRRFGGSCYYLSNITSTAIEANHTCNVAYLNSSQLMQIRHSMEFFYIAHVLVTNNLSELLIEISAYSIKDIIDKTFSSSDQTRWKSDENKFRQTLLKYNKRKMKKMGQARRDKSLDDDIETNSINRVQTPVTSTVALNRDNPTTDQINSFVADDVDDSEQLADIHKVCDQFVWNAIETNAKGYLLTRYLLSDKFICSITDIDPGVSYKHMCQYVLDFCFDNNLCGKHGRCVNNLVGFKCSCYFWSDGPFCQKISMKFVQLVAGLFLVLILLVLTRESIQEYQQRQVKKLWDLCRTLPTTPDPVQRMESIIDKRAEHTSTSESEKQKRNPVRLLFVCALTFIILCCLHIIPMIHYLTSFPLHKIDQSAFGLVIKNIIQGIKTCRQTSILNIDTHIFFIISCMLCLIFSLLIKLKKNCSDVCTGRPGDCLSPIEPFETANRYETAALCGIIMVEVLTALEHFFIDLSELWTQGVLRLIFERALLPFLYSIRYYPIFASLQQRNIYVRFFAFSYMMGIIGYTIIRRSSCMDYLPLPTRFSIDEEARRRMELGTWTIIYGVLKNTPQFHLLSFISAELTVRFIYDSIYLNYMKKQSIVETPISPGPEFAMYNSADLIPDSPISDTSSSTYWSYIRKTANKIYRWDEDFQFTTMAMCAYTLAFVLLFYLTCVFTFQSILGTRSLYFLTFCLQQIFYIDIEDWSFHYEIIISGFLTLILFAIQLFYGTIKYKEHTKQLKNNNYEEIPSVAELEANSIASISIGYLSSVFLNIVGGFFIWFHIILFIVILCSLTLYHIFTFQLDHLDPLFSIVSFTLPLLVLYGLTRYIRQWLGTFASSQQYANGIYKSNEKMYAVLVYFTFISSFHIAIISSLIRLIKGLVFNVLLMPRIDCSYLGRTCEKYDGAFMAYASYLHMEKAYRQRTQPLVEQKGNIPVPRDELHRSEPGSSQSIRDDEYSSGEDTEEEKSFRSVPGAQTADFNDASSSNSIKYLPKEVIETPEDSTLPSSNYVQQGLSDSQQLRPKSSTRKERNDQNDVSTLAERQPLMTSTCMDGDEDKANLPKLPVRNDKNTTAEARDDRFLSSDV